MSDRIQADLSSCEEDISDSEEEKEEVEEEIYSDEFQDDASEGNGETGAAKDTQNRKHTLPNSNRRVPTTSNGKQ